MLDENFLKTYNVHYLTIDFTAPPNSSAGIYSNLIALYCCLWLDSIAWAEFYTWNGTFLLPSWVLKIHSKELEYTTEQKRTQREKTSPKWHTPPFQSSCFLCHCSLGSNHANQHHVLPYLSTCVKQWDSYLLCYNKTSNPSKLHNIFQTTRGTARQGTATNVSGLNLCSSHFGRKKWSFAAVWPEWTSKNNFHISWPSRQKDHTPRLYGSSLHLLQLFLHHGRGREEWMTVNHSVKK